MDHKQRIGSHQVIVILREGKHSHGTGRLGIKSQAGGGMPPFSLQILFYPGESPSEEEHLAFQMLLVAVQRLQWLTREM